MEEPITRRRLLGGGAAAGAALVSGCTGMTPFVGQEVTERFTVSPDRAQPIRIVTDVGEINVRGEARSDVDVDATKQSSSLRTDLDELVLTGSEEAGVFVIRAEFEGETGWLESRPSIDLDVAIPREQPIDRLESAIGRIGVRDVESDLALDTTTGRTTVADVDGDVSVETGTGRVSVADVTGTVTAQTTTGRIEVRNVGRVGDLTSTTGRIETEIPAIDGDTAITAATGRIEAALNPDMDAEVRASTSTGSVDVEGLTFDDAEQRSGFVRGRLGEGGPSLELQTNTGRITISALA